MTRAILWDMDGVLADTGDAHYDAWRRLFEERGETITRAQFDATFGMANGQILQSWLGADTPREVLDKLGARKEALFRQGVAHGAGLLPGVLEWLAWGRRQGYRQVVASSGEMANIVAVVNALHIGNYFEALVSGAFLPCSKPDPAVFLYAAAAVGARPEDCLVIEDGVVGVEAAQRAGMHCLALTTTHPREKLAHADRVVDSLLELDEAALVALWERPLPGA